MDYKQIAVFNERKLKAENEGLKQKIAELEKQCDYEKSIYQDYKKIEDENNQVNDLIDYVLTDNFCEDDPKAYLHYLEKDMEELDDMKDNNQIDECLYSHFVEELELLKDIITITKGVIV